MNYSASVKRVLRYLLEEMEEMTAGTWLNKKEQMIVWRELHNETGRYLLNSNLICPIVMCY